MELDAVAVLLRRVRLDVELDRVRLDVELDLRKVCALQLWS